MANQASPPAPAPIDPGEVARTGASAGAAHPTEADPSAGADDEAGRAESVHRPGDRFANKYRLEHLLGEGGMGSVWRARNEALDAAVAIKVIRHREGATDAKRRLLQEARAAAKLEHPAVVRVFDFGESERGEPFIVMELLYGESLGERLARSGPEPAAEAVRLILPVAAGLVAAHAKGVVHRDLKPDNVVLVRRDDGVISPKIVDFGIAKVPPDERRGTLTLLGTIVGSPDYMSPEQARGQSDVDARSDVWSLAVMLYELMTGARPFEGANYNALLSAIMINDPAPVTALGAGDDALWAVMRRALEKDRAARFPSAREFGRALGAWALERGVTTDVTGASIEARWSPFAPASEPPPPPEVAHTPSHPLARAGRDTPALPAATGAPPHRRLALAVPFAIAAAAGLVALTRLPAARLVPAAVATARRAPASPASPAPGPAASAAPLTAAVLPPTNAAPPLAAAASNARPSASAPPGRPAPPPRRPAAPNATASPPTLLLTPPEPTAIGDALPIPAEPNFLGALWPPRPAGPRSAAAAPGRGAGP
jgi:eukaryotic-like serine/threonine-protein kinase